MSVADNYTLISTQGPEKDLRVEDVVVENGMELELVEYEEEMEEQEEEFYEAVEQKP